MEGTLLVGVATGAMKPLLSKLSNLLEKEYAKLKGVRREIKSTRDEMRSMKAALEALADAEQLDPEMIEWRDEVRELSFDMEDCVDDFVVHADTKQDGRKGLKGFFDKLKKLKPRHEIAGEIKELKARAMQASERHKRYKLDRSTPEPTSRDIDPRLHALYVEVGKLVGIEGPKKHIIDWLKDEGSSTQLRVVSIVGPGGLGKTTLGNAVFQTIKEEFSCKAFVSVSRKPNLSTVLKAIATRVGMAHDPSNDDVQWLIDSLREYLQDKKYLIVIDDLWSTEAWKTIKDALLNNEHGSRIITTTRNSAVASFCSSEGGYVYKMEPLSSIDSRRLFLGRAFRSEDLCPLHLKEVSERILEKCAGLPLAIITMSSLLADQTAEEVWNKALAAVGSSLAKEDGAGDMTKILSLSYFDLPHYMRACLLYLSSYPEDYIIEKKSLIHKWMAEGFIREVEGQSTYEVGEGYFNDFINRSLIQPAELEYGEVMACRVHDIILDFITCKAKEENFMTSFGDAEHGGKHKVRRLSVVSRDNEMATVSWDLSHVRSLAHFGDDWQNFMLDFPVLRVLDIKGCDDLENDLANIEKLLLLKYFRLRTYDDITEIPEGIGKLKYLETLDMRGVTIRKLPSTMTQLQRLAHLYADFEPACLLDGILGQLQSLEELEVVQVSETELEKFLQELGQLTKLRTLSVRVKRSTLSKKVDNVKFVGTSTSSYNLHHLTIRSDYTRRCFLSLESWCLVNPVSLRKICIDDYSIDKVPNWMISLGNLRVLHLSLLYCTRPEDMAILGGMPALVALKLRTWYGRNGKIFIRTGFRSLKYFSLGIYRCGTAVEFEKGSMPKVEHLELNIKVHKEECVNYAFDFGIQHLSALTKLDLFTYGYINKIMVAKLIETALGKFRNRPTLSWVRYDGERCVHFQTAIKKAWEREKKWEEKNGKDGGPCSFLGLLLEEIKHDALPRMRVMGMLRSLDDLAKSLCAARPPAAAESAAFACALSEIQCEISSTDGPTKAAASRQLSAIARHLLASPASAAAVPDDLFIHLAQDLVPHLDSGSPLAIAEAARVMAASPSAVFSVLFKPLTSCLSSPDPQASTAAAAAFCELSAPPADMNYRQQACQLADENAVSARDILSQHLANRSSKFGGTLSFLEDERRFESFFNMKRRTFNYICCLVKSMEDVRSYTFLDGRVMRSEDQVALAMRMLISGGPVETVASDFSIKESTVSLITFRFVEAMMKQGSYHMRWPDCIEMEKIKSKFDLIHMLPNCCGVIDTTYIMSAEPNHDEEKNYSMSVQVIIDPDMRFVDYCIDWPGNKNKSSILHGSPICTECEKGESLNDGKVKLSDGSEIGEYIIGDTGFPLLPWLLTPYREKDLSDPKVEFNRRLSAARAITLRGLARLKDTWKCLHGELYRPENPREFSDVIAMCCMVHNIVIDMEGKFVEEEYVPNSCDVNYSQEAVEEEYIPNEDSVRMRDALSQHLASRPSRCAGDEEEQVAPSDAGDEEEHESSGRRAEEETHSILAT